MSDAPVAIAARVTAVDGLRGLLAVVVLAWHVAAPFGVAWLLPAANLAVATFFVLSGYVLTRGWDGRYGIFLIRRFLRLWPVYALCLAAGYGVAGIVPVWSEFLWYPVIDADTRPFIDPPVWSLFVEAWAMPFMPLIVWAGAGPTMRTMLCMAALVALGLLSPRISFGVLFVAGAFLAQFDFRSRPLEAAVPQWLGRISYSLYLTHWLVLTLASRAFGPWGGVAALPAVLLVAWAVYRGVERPSIGASRFIGRLVAGRRAPSAPPGATARGAA
jgi:peptidoglycan/LPS O-acetylase OafA/YrhL